VPTLLTPAPSGIPTNLPTVGLPSDLPTLNALCGSAHHPIEAAVIYVGAAEAGVAQYAQTCVYQNMVPLSVTKGLSGKLYAPTTSDQDATVVHFKEAQGDGQLDVTVAKQANGKFYIVKVTVH
jgi:hypothetical protein